MEYVIKIIVAVIKSIIGPTFIYSIKRKYRKHYPLSEKDKKIIEEKDEVFFKDFILPNLSEKYFYEKTNIPTNEKTIPKLIQFRNKLGPYYSWDKIKKAMRHLDLDKEEIEIRLNKFQKRFCEIFLIFYFIIVLSLIVFTFYIVNKYKVTTLFELFLTLFIFLIPTIGGYFIISGLDSTFTAISMEKRLKEIEDKK